MSTSQDNNNADNKKVLPENQSPDIVNQLTQGNSSAKPKVTEKKQGEATGGQNRAPKAAVQPRKPAQRRPQPQGKPAQKAAASRPTQNKPANPNTNAKPKPNTTNTAANPKPNTTNTAAKRNNNRGTSNSKNKLKIIPLGGLGEVGKNITYYEYGNDAILVDCGLAFPDESMLGIDIVIPDFTYVIENQNKIRGLCITHGHEDHIGSIVYLLKHINIPIFGTRLTVGLIEGKLKEHGLLRTAKLNQVKPGDTLKFGSLSVEYIHVNHSIPDACSLAIHTPVGVIIQTGDFKIDFTPIAGDVINLARFGELGSKGVLALLSDSTNAERPGSSSSERIVGGSLEKLFVESTDKRIIVASFASNVHRVQQIVDAAVKTDRKVAVSGRSMENVVGKATEMGYLKIPNGVLIDVDTAERMPREKTVLITTGSQGEPMSALTRMARGDHRKVTVTEHDCIIISATPIPGNEKLVSNVINDLLKLGAKVIYEKMYEIHVSGHACQDELKMMIALTKPKFFIPVHGEYKHLMRHAEIAVSMGIPKDKIHIGENGQVIELDKNTLQQNTTVTSGRVLVDGLGIGDVGSIVLRDRKHLSEDGLIVVITTIKKGEGKILAGPDIVSRGFVYVRESEDLIDKAREIAKKAVENSLKDGKAEWGAIKNSVRDGVSDYVWQATKRRPMILPVIQEV